MKPFLRIFRPHDTELQAHYAGQQAQLKALGADAEPSQRLPLLGELGEAACILGQPEISLGYLQEALSLAEQSADLLAVVSNRVRLGTTLQHLERYSEAENQFELALKGTLEPELAGQRDLALQQTGKLLAEQGQYGNARQCFQQALKLRQQKQDPDLIAASEDALELLDALGPTEDGFAATLLQTEFDLSGLPAEAQRLDKL